MKGENQYSITMCENYDSFMEAGYYDHESEVKALESILRGRKRILELGVGTGILAGGLADKGFEVTGIDHTEHMIKKCKDKGIDKKVNLIVQNVLDLDLKKRYDASISCGGVWYMEDVNARTYLESHITSVSENIRGLKKVAEHLNSRGLLVLAIQEAHRNKSLPLKNGVYRQEIKFKKEKGIGYVIEKDYFFTDEQGKEKGYQHCTYIRFNPKLEMQMMNEAGFVKLRTDKTGQFILYEKN